MKPTIAKRIDLYADYLVKAKLELSAMKRFEYEMSEEGRDLEEESFEYNGYIRRYNTYVEHLQRHWRELRDLGLADNPYEPPLETLTPITDMAA